MEESCFKSRFCSEEAFTLIELLVVVLIIGILAAVAVPQYQKAVWKSRYTQAKIMAKSIANAEEIYLLANGKYTPNFDELDVEIPTKDISHYPTDAGSSYIAKFSWGQCILVTNDIPGRNTIDCIIYKNKKEYISYVLGFNHTSNKYSMCIAYGENAKPTPSDISYQVCAGETNRNTPSAAWGSNSDYWKYGP